MAQRGMKFGIFLAPFHRLGENPTLAMARDMELIEWLDWLGYDEAWVGEHHSAGWEVIASPEIFIAEAVERCQEDAEFHAALRHPPILRSAMPLSCRHSRTNARE